MTAAPGRIRRFSCNACLHCKRCLRLDQLFQQGERLAVSNLCGSDVQDAPTKQRGEVELLAVLVEAVLDAMHDAVHLDGDARQMKSKIKAEAPTGAEAVLAREGDALALKQERKDVAGYVAPASGRRFLAALQRSKLALSQAQLVVLASVV